MDNRYYQFNCPPLMSDARFITNYTANQTTETFIQHMNNIENQHDYRYFLQTQGNRLMDEERELVEKNNMCLITKRCAKRGCYVNDGFNNNRYSYFFYPNLGTGGNYPPRRCGQNPGNCLKYV